MTRSVFQKAFDVRLQRLREVWRIKCSALFWIVPSGNSGIRSVADSGARTPCSENPLGRWNGRLNRLRIVALDALSVHGSNRIVVGLPGRDAQIREIRRNLRGGGQWDIRCRRIGLAVDAISDDIVRNTWSPGQN